MWNTSPGSWKTSPRKTVETNGASFEGTGGAGPLFFCAACATITAVKRLIIADSHVGQRSDDSAAMTEVIGRAVEVGVDEIIYLGDSFQYFIGMSKFWTTALTEVLDAWRVVRARGVRIVAIEGNRDFFLDEAELASEIDWSGRRYEFDAGEKRFCLDHGDLVNRRDFQYRFWSSISKSRVARLWARLLPKSIAVAIVRNMENHLANTNRKFRYTKPVSDLRTSAEDAWMSGVDVLFWGHFHTYWDYRKEGHVALIIPAWLENRTAVMVDSDGNWYPVNSEMENCDFPEATS